jgi:DNA-binding transcriptional ArsR family regulator
MLSADVAIAAIANPTRRAILRLVWDTERPSGEIASRFGVTGPAISQHLRVLREAGLVSERRDGTRRLYRARPETLASVRDELDAFWVDRLGRLKDAVESVEAVEAKEGTR